MKKSEGILFGGGYSTVRAWKRWQLEGLMRKGLSLKIAQARLRPVYRNTVHNLIVTVGKNMVGDLLIDEESTGFTYHALGTSNATPAVGDTQLGSESVRKIFTSRSRSGNVVTLSMFYPAAECTLNIQECGIFGGAAAGAAANSGILFSHFLQSYDNSGGTHDLTFDYVLTIG